jgi:hypothetical protein
MATYQRKPGLTDAFGYYATDAVEELVKTEISTRHKQKQLTAFQAIGGIVSVFALEYVKERINKNIYPKFQPLRSLESAPQTINVTPKTKRKYQRKKTRRLQLSSAADTGKVPKRTSNSAV